MKPQPVDNVPFTNRIYQHTKITSYGKCIKGFSRGYEYNVHVGEDNRTKNIMYKLYCVTKESKWVKSFLRYFSGNKLHKEIRSEAK